MAYMVMKGVEKRQDTYPPLRIEPGTTHFADIHYAHCATQAMTARHVLIFVLISFHMTRCQPFIDCDSIEINMRVFPGKLCPDCHKNHGCGQKKPEGTTL